MGSNHFNNAHFSYWGIGAVESINLNSDQNAEVTMQFAIHGGNTNWRSASGSTLMIHVVYGH